MKPLKLIGLSIILVSAASLSIKHGVNLIGELTFADLTTNYMMLITNEYLILGVLFYMLSSLTWLLAIAKTDLSKAYPILASAYAFIPILSWIIFKEAVSSLRWVGIAVVCIGVILMARS